MSDEASSRGEIGNRKAARRIIDALSGLAYGSVEITVHDHKIVQIERREKKRMKIPVDDQPTFENDCE